MEPQPPVETKKWTDNNLVKVIIIGVLILVLLIPSVMISELVRERSSRQYQVTQEVSSKWGQMQTLIGPYIAIPYAQEVKFNNGTASEWKLQTLYYFPETLEVEGDLSPFIKKRSIFNVLLYESELRLRCTFHQPDLKALQLDAAHVQWDKAALYLGVTDLTGMGSQVYAHVGSDSLLMSASAATSAAVSNGLRCAIADSLVRSESFDVTLDLKVKGSQGLYFTPVARVNNVRVQSTWPSPKFEGKFLPDSSSVSSGGFEANWSILDINRQFAQQWTSEYPQIFPSVASSGFDPYRSMESSSVSTAFGVELMSPVDHYTKNERTVKYSILLISLTFAVYFFCEILKKQKVHPLQYGLVGAALVIFFVLLLSLSEHIGFDAAYASASVATIGLITLYSSSIFTVKKYAWAVGGLQVLLFGCIYIILQLEDYALLAGSIGLFCTIALIMWMTRRVKW